MTETTALAQRTSRTMVRRRGVWADSGIALTGLGHYYPETVLYADDTAPIAGDAVDRAILGDVTAKSRHRAAEDETVADMAVRACRQALDAAGLDPARLDLLVLTNWTDRIFAPELAPQVAEAIGASRALAFDLCGACTGFIHAVQTCAAFLASPTAHQRALVVSSERFSRRVRPGSKGELVAGDAAAAAVLELDADRPGGSGLIDSILYSEGRYADLTVGMPPHGYVRSRPQLVDHAADSIAAAVDELLARNDLDIDDIDWLVPHSGTAPILSTVRTRLGIDPNRLVTNFEVRANTSSASIPVVLSEFFQTGKFKRGDLFLTPAVGGGWFYGGLLFRL